MVDDVDALDTFDIGGNVDMERDGDDEADEQVEDELKEEKAVDEVEKEEEDENIGKEPRMIGQGEMGNPSTDDADTMVDDQPTVLPGQGQQM